MKNWKKVKLGSLLTESKIVSETPDTDKRLRVRLNMLGVEKRPKTNDKEGATKYYIRKSGQFIYGKQNLHKGAFGIILEELDGFESSSDIPAFDVDESCYPEWIYYFFKKGNFYEKLEGLARGVGSKRIQPIQIFNFDIYLPSRDEQKKILEEISKLEIQYTNILTEIENQENWLSELRQSTLDKAIRGDLTENWRSQNLNMDSAEELVNLIQTKKKKLIEDRIINNEKMASSISQDMIPFQIPKDWRWCKIIDIAEKVGSGSTPTGGQNIYVSEGIMFIRSQNVYNNGLHLSNVAFIPLSIHEKMKNTKVKSKDILLNITGASIGRCTLIPDIFETANINQHVAIIRMVNPELRYFIHKVINSPYFQNKIMDVQVGVSREGLSISNLKQLLVPIPPLEEQIIINTKIESIFKFCEEILVEIKNIHQELEKLFHASLYKLLGESEIINFTKKESINIEREYTRETKYNNKTTFMELIDLLKEHGKLHAEDLWKMSKHFDNKNIGDSIDMFYADLKEKIEMDKTIKEVENEKGYLDLV